MSNAFLNDPAIRSDVLARLSACLAAGRLQAAHIKWKTNAVPSAA
jgi:hypothetical protein